MQRGYSSHSLQNATDDLAKEERKTNLQSVEDKKVQLPLTILLLHVLV